MKISEVIPKTIKPLTPQQVMIRNLKQNIENSRKKLQAEKDRQRIIWNVCLYRHPIQP